MAVGEHWWYQRFWNGTGIVLCLNHNQRHLVISLKALLFVICAALRGPRSQCSVNHPGHHAEQGTWASRTRKRSEAGCGRPEDGGVRTAKTVKRPPQQPAQPQYAKYWAPLMRKRHILPLPAQPRHTNHWAPRTRKQHQQEHRPQRPTESSDPTQHAKGRMGDCPGPRKETTARRNVTQGRGCSSADSHCQLWPLFALLLASMLSQTHHPCAKDSLEGQAVPVSAMILLLHCTIKMHLL